MVVVPAALDAAVVPAPASAPVPHDRDALRFALLVGAAVLVGLGLRIAIGLTDDAPSTDETAYLRSGESLAEGHGFARGVDRPELHFPPLVPFLFGMAGKVVDDPHTGAVMVTVVAGTLAILPLAFTARRIGGHRAGVITAWVAALTPAISTTLFVRGGGSEGVYTLVVATAVMLVVYAAGTRGTARALQVAGAGLAVGLAYLTRPEGLFFALPLGVAVLYLAWRDSRPAHEPGEAWHRVWRRGGPRAVARVAAPVAAFGLPILACVAPYAAFLHSHTGSWELSAKTQDASIEAWLAVARDDREARDVVLYDIDDEFRFTAGSHSLPSLAVDDPGGYARIVAANVDKLWNTVVPAEGGAWARWQLLPLPVWALAVWGAWRHRSRSMALIVGVALLPVVTSLMFFVQPRYLVGSAALATIPVGLLLAGLAVPRARLLGGVALAFLATSSIFAFHGSGGWWHPNDHTSLEAAGKWIAENTDLDDRIMARSQIVEYYSHRTTVALPYTDYPQMLAYGRHYGVQYLVLDANTAANLRPQYEFLRTIDVAPGLKLVHESLGEGGATRVFAFHPATPADDAPPGPHLGFVGDGAA